MKIPDFKGAAARRLVRLGVSADLLTAAGLFLSLLSAWFIVREDFFAAACALLSSGLCDLLDGAVARASGKSGVFGGILDSTLDRYGDGAVLGAVAVHFMELAQSLYAWLAVSALVGSFAISYVRARAECEIEDCRVGFWERGERLVLIALALLAHNLPAALWALGIGTHWTVFQRLMAAKARAGGKETPFYRRAGGRDSRPYFLKVALLVLGVLFWRA